MRRKLKRACYPKRRIVFISEYIRTISDILLYLLLPAQDFHNKPFRYFLRVIMKYININKLTIKKLRGADCVNV